MYLHQVIEDLKQTRDCKRTIEIINLLSKCHCFHIGNHNDLEKPYKKFIGKGEIFKGEFIKYFRLPYKRCWFDYEHSENKSHKQRLLVVEMERPKKNKKFYGIYMLKFLFHPDFKRWLYDNFIVGIIKEPVLLKKNVHILDIKTLEEINKISEKYARYISVDASYLQGALMFLNCKNLETEIINPSIKLNKSRRKKGRQELFKYHILKIVPSSKKSEGNVKTKPINHNRIHFCRGHFKEYTKSNLLFGKHAGLYWWQPHVRGNKKKGIVIKDYEL